jgi:hypothetical protein
MILPKNLKAKKKDVCKALKLADESLLQNTYNYENTVTFVEDFVISIEEYTHSAMAFV